MKRFTVLIWLILRKPLVFSSSNLAQFNKASISASSRMKCLKTAAGNCNKKRLQNVNPSGFWDPVNMAIGGLLNSFVKALAAFDKIGRICKQFHRERFLTTVIF
jgi:hypothetical protein